MEKAQEKEIKGGLAAPNKQYYAWAYLLKNVRQSFVACHRSELGRVLTVMMEGQEVQRRFLYKFGDPKFFKKIQFKILYDWAVLWYELRKIANLSHYNEDAPLWDSPGSPEWTKDALAIPLKEAGLLQWKHLFYNGELRDFDNLNIEVGGGLSKFKYLQKKSWAGNVTEEVISTNGLVDQMQLDTSMKKEVTKWYWLMLDIVDGEFNLPEEIWRGCLPEQQLKDLWQVSTTLLYNTVKPAALRRNNLFSIHRAFWTPRKLSRLRQDNVVRCKKCGSASADDLHMFIDCLLLLTFWQEVGDAVNDILPSSPEVRPLIVMFGCSDETRKMGRDGAKLLFYMMLVARREICRKWISPVPPTFIEWKNSLIYYYKFDCYKVCKRTRFWNLLKHWLGSGEV
ncbi:hypothetical protein NDU88_007284 [Pleurodeles waltl]|uniref:Reverse transcriptase zinc-binding domain-containing protein n=1 Tax=Pleurodeles waltl TaxID=8319 RepID=A0AAV7TZA6_PLEWA|nr:hypothetical protein NDU88_007284 [Pleurodeles waltl]